MPSPFPGMNPYLEQRSVWPDFHGGFLYQLREAVAKRVSEKYFVQVETRMVLQETWAEEQVFIGNTDVSVGRTRDYDWETDSAVATITAPVEVILPSDDEELSRSLEIRERHNRRLVTVIELLKPGDKMPGESPEFYLIKRGAILRGQTHLVEIDLMRFGRKPSPPVLPPSDYDVFVSVWEDRPRAGIWPFNLRDPIPDIPIPLSKPDAPILISLKEILDRTYDSGAFEHYLYDSLPEPPLSPEDNTWAIGFIPPGRGANAVAG